MTAEIHHKTRVLFLVSNDYGELGFAMSLLRGQEFASQARLLMPERLFSVNKDALPVVASSYSTREDIIRVVEAHQPDLIFLMCGYLLSNDKLLSPESRDALLDHFRDRGCRVVTSDPFLCLAQRLTLAEVDIRMASVSAGASAMARWLTRLILRLLGSKRKLVNVPKLASVTHLYPHSIPPHTDNTPRLAVFNPNIIRGVTRAHLGDDGRFDDEVHDSRPSWLFVLSGADLGVQLSLLGLQELKARLFDMLRYASACGRHATLLAHSWLIDRLANPPADSELLSLCSYAEFERRLLDAEYAFYWNAFSNSYQLRLANELPIFVFDRGHLARIIKPYYEIARSAIFEGWEPPYLDQRQPLDLRVLRELAEKQEPALRMLRENWQSLPTPDELLSRLLGADITARTA